MALTRAEIISVGTEFLLGGMLETTSLFVAQELALLGIEVGFKSIVGDNEKDIEDALRMAIKRSCLVITTGGLGPSDDDLTKKVMAKVTNRRLVLREELLRNMMMRSSLEGHRIPPHVSRQALVPSRSHLMENSVGTTPGFIIDEKDHCVIALPGSPRETRKMFQSEVVNYLSTRMENGHLLKMKTLRTCGLDEKKAAETLRSLSLQRDALRIGFVTTPAGVDIRLIARITKEQSDSLLTDAEATIRTMLGDWIYGVDGETMELVVGRLLTERRMTLSVAESCTGGLILQRLTSVPGSSGYVNRGVICVEKHGAVSHHVAVAMAHGVRSRSGSDVGLSVTGIAGPGGATQEKPVGLVYIALATERKAVWKLCHLDGSREEVRFAASQAAMDVVRRFLVNKRAGY